MSQKLDVTGAKADISKIYIIYTWHQTSSDFICHCRRMSGCNFSILIAKLNHFKNNVTFSLLKFIWYFWTLLLWGNEWEMRLLIQVEVFGSAATSTQCDVKCLQGGDGGGWWWGWRLCHHSTYRSRESRTLPPLIIIIIQRKCEELDSV